ncbi:CPBP family intramembrane glutamic endopeptidase [Erythrobacter sp. 3-20A1M]|uniref:CPBP family intramembrane glutamic endopeptidase n=1 Tax=Erythrobacter sp. 3-20A1M TaxID=2653850 RepID=UPI00203C3A48|nr:CPBP family intramembrane glutamic endopeptidase [Erythrobacter sp. 3-20A1M]
MDANLYSQPRPLGWWRFILQFVTVVFAYMAMSLPAVAVFGMGPLGLLLSVVGSMVGGLLVAWLWLRADRALGEAWNLSAFRNGRRTMLVGFGSALGIVAWFTVGGMLLRALGMPTPDVSILMDGITSSPLMLAAWIVLVAWLAAGLGEELLWRGFLMDRLLRLPGLRGQIWPVIIIQAIIFGLPHIYQGWGGTILTGIIGLYLGWLRTRVGWTLLPLVLAHAGVDTVMMLLGYAQKMGWVAAG